MMFLQRSRSTRTVKPRVGGYRKMENVSSHTPYNSFRNGDVLNSVLKGIAGC
jgi:hypothetical protein